MKLQELKDAYSVCIIDCGGRSKGSGFVIKFADRLYVMTDYHVLFNRNGNPYHDDCTLHFTNQNDSYNQSLFFRVDLVNTKVFSDEGLDIATFEVGNENTTLEIGNGSLADITPFELSKVQVSSLWGIQLYLYGYPTSLHPEAPFEIKPFITNGIMSSYDDDVCRFVTNIPAFYGNSGSPAIFINESGEIQVIGIVQQLIHFRLEWRNYYEAEAVRSDWQNSGYSICLDVNKLITFLQKNVTNKSKS